MWVNAALRYTSCRSRHTAVAAALTSVAARRCLSTSDGGGPSSTAARVTASPVSVPPVQNTQKESRFTRTSAPSSTPMRMTAGLGDASTGTAHAVGTAAFPSVEDNTAHIPYSPNIRSNRMLVMYLQRVQTVLRRNRRPSVEALSRCELNKILFPAIKGVDVPTVTLLLQTLQMADVSETAPIVQDAVAWFSLYGYNLSLPKFIKVMALLHHFNAPLVKDWIQSVPQRLPSRDATSLTATQAVTVLTAALPCLRFPTVEETEGGLKEAEVAPAAAALVELAELLREQCKGAEFVACGASLIADLLRALLTFKASREWPWARNKNAWLALEEATCLILATPSQADTMEVATAVRLLTALSDVAPRGQHDADSGGAADATAEAEERLATVLTQRLTTAVEALQSVAPVAAATATDEAPQYAVSELPSPWRARDVREVWNTCLRSSAASAMAKELADGERPVVDSAYQKLLAGFQASLSTFITQLFVAHRGDVGVAEMAFAMALGIAQADRAAAQRARDTRPVTSESSSTFSLNTATPVGSHVADVIPPALVEALLQSSSDQLHARSVTWTPATVRSAVSLFEHRSDGAHRTRAFELAQAWYKQLQKRARDGERMVPDELLAFFTAEVLRQERLGVDAAVDASLRRWSVSEVLYFFSRLGTAEGFAGGVEGAAVLRQAGSALCSYAAKASAAQLASLVECYGAAQVRNDEFCDAAVRRLSELLDVSLITATRNINFASSGSAVARQTEAAAATTSITAFAAAPSYALDANGRDQGNVSASTTTTGSGDPAAGASPVTLSQLTQLLRSFALMEVRQTKPFVDAAPHVTLAANADQGSAEEVSQLLAAYAKMLIWNYPVFRALAERFCRIRKEDVHLDQLLTTQLAMLRMDVTLPPVTTRFFEALTEQYSPERSGKGSSLSTTLRRGASEPAKSRRDELKSVVMHLSVLSRVRTSSHVIPPNPSVSTGIIEFIVKHAKLLRIEELAEVLLSLARLEEGRSAAFEELTVRTLGLLPTAPPRVMAHIAEAYALARRSDDAELFTLIAERTVAMRHDMAAVTIASILASFAKVGVRNDRLFIEVIPRVRHVSTYGTPRDVVNVVSAYAAVNLWHYKLFARLADRAIQLRADFRVTELVRLLNAYATVQMRYDVLFTEFAPRIQTLAHLLVPSDLAGIVSSYSQLNIPCVPVWKATASRAVDVADAFTEEEAEQLLDAYSTQDFYHEECVRVLTARFPALSKIPFNIKEAENTGPKAEEVADDDERR
ncbi:putative mitochondrial hypothetical protein [Leptomonas pyrrhocoris]|uniref:RNA-editing substrate-binding complex 6 protein domain-containing protein n=1 Tax=Leptomonas pyrrhocoris TaxID=157538 RepID=A0A0N0DW99_LEPPY|nr:putative mitochondrial hypothetical protein [Leptomonas pyrrhocoris]KPA81522.1 putative mitochondrial hypothetical protein [Leptomonas pyrrhocoris]|eukprot:XP_015659961.1 putative mitochondrial hypothetical protein [Leptomonas pyrrhocoris]